MALPVLIKTWREAPNLVTTAQGSVLATAQAVLHGVVAALVGFAGSPFHVDHSCSSVAAGVPGDNVNRWTSPAQLVWGAPASPHSWIVLESVMGWQLLISCESSSQNLYMALSWTGAFTGGTTTARPTATDQIVVLNNTGWGVNSNAQYRYHVQAPLDGSAIWVGICTAGTMVQTWDIISPIIAPGVTLTDPIYGKVTPGNLYLDSTFIANSNWIGRHAGVTLALRCTTEGDSTNTVASFFSAPDARTGGWPMLGLGFLCTTVGQVSRAHGTWPDVRYSVTTALCPTGTHLPLTPAPTYDWVKLGQIFRPWFAGTPMLFS